MGSGPVSVDFEQYPKLNYSGVLDWLVSVNCPFDVWRKQPTYLLSECIFLLAALLNLAHAIRVGGRWKYLWLGTVIHGLTIENVAFWFPEYIDNYWHSQTTIVLLGRRLPLHIICLYPAFTYTASVSVARLRLPRWAEPFAVGLTEVLIDIPYDIMAVRFVHWTWHDTDPNIFDRHYWVPWNSYYFHATFAASFTFFFHFYRRVFIGNGDKWASSNCVWKELLCTVLAGMSGMPGGILLFLPIYHPLHDIFNIHTENCVLILFIVFFLLIWCADRHPEGALQSRPVGGKCKHERPSIEIFLHLIPHYLLYWWMASFGHPEREVSVGLHEQTGPCDQKEYIRTAFGMDLPRRKYFCPTDYDEGYFDFHCTPGGAPPPNYYQWYTICGVPFANRAEYASMLTAICVLAAVVFYQMHCRSGPEVRGDKTTPNVQTPKTKKVKRQ